MPVTMNSCVRCVKKKMRLRRRWTNFMNSGMPWQRRRRGETDLWLQGAAACGAAGSAGGAVRALLALAFLFFYTPMRFSGCLLLCAAVYFCAVALFVAAAGTPFGPGRACHSGSTADWRFGSIYCAGGSNRRLWPHRPGKSGFCRGGVGSRSEWHKAVFGAAKPFGGGVGLCFGSA